MKQLFVFILEVVSFYLEVIDKYITCVFSSYEFSTLRDCIVFISGSEVCLRSLLDERVRAAEETFRPACADV